MTSARKVVNAVLAPVGASLVSTSRLDRSERRWPSTRRADIGAWMCREYGSAVLRGPFAGQLLEPSLDQVRSDLPAALVGEYEREVHGLVRDIVALEPAVVVDVGRGAWLYAIGWARLVPGVHVHVRDADDVALEGVRRLAELNHVAARITTARRIDYAEVDRLLAGPGPHVLRADVDGLERELLNPRMVPRLADAHVLVRVHDRVLTRPAEILAERFHRSHAIRVVESEGRAPDAIPELAGLTADDRWLCVSDGRRSPARWLWMVPLESS